MKHLISTIALITCCITLFNCGGAGAGSNDKSPETVRPKTFDGIVLTLDSTVRFEFIRNTGSAPALVSGDVETGTFLYTLGGVQLRKYRNTNGDDSDVRYPDSVSSASYTYRAINTSAGILTLTAVGINDLTTSGTRSANNGSLVYLFNSDSNGTTNNVVVIDLTFSKNGQSITSNEATVRIPGGNQRYDNVLVPTTLSLATGGYVSTNYNPTLDPKRDSKIAPASLNNKLVNYTNGKPDTTLDFTIQFVADNAGPANNSNIDEIGQGLLRVAGNSVDDAVNYTYTRTGGTDDAILVISNANNTFDGRYTLKFSGVDNGAYIGEVDAGTADASDVSGRFFVPGR